MSYEGYTQNICVNGHYTETDVYTNNPLCAECHSELKWENSVDMTNGDSVGIIPLSVLEEKFGTGKSDSTGVLLRIPEPGECDQLRCWSEYDESSKSLIYHNLIVGFVHGQ